MPVKKRMSRHKGMSIISIILIVIICILPFVLTYVQNTNVTDLTYKISEVSNSGGTVSITGTLYNNTKTDYSNGTLKIIAYNNGVELTYIVGTIGVLDAKDSVNFVKSYPEGSIISKIVYVTQSSEQTLEVSLTQWWHSTTLLYLTYVLCAIVVWMLMMISVLKIFHRK